LLEEGKQNNKLVVEMEVVVEVSPSNYDSVSSASPEFQRENGDGDEQGWPLPVVAARVECPDGAVDAAEDAPHPSKSVDSKQLSGSEVVQLTTPQRKTRPTRTLIVLY